MKFRIEFGGQSQDYRKNQWGWFRNDVLGCYPVSEYKFFVDGEQVSKEQALQEVDDVGEEYLNKKLKTHKRVMVCTGVTTLPNNWHEVWVRR